MRPKPKNRATAIAGGPKAALLGACLAALGCGSLSPLGPVDPEDVRVTMSVSGGIAGIAYTVVVDGATGIARVGPCGAQCGPAAGGTELPVSPAQIERLVDELDASGILELDGADFGTQCCDDFFVVLSYERGTRSATVRGGQSLYPRGFVRAVGLLAALARGEAPAIVSPETADTDWPRDPYTLGSVLVSGRRLVAEVTYGGGCAAHRMDLVLWGGWMESSPVQINALVTHDDGDDPCDALVTEERAFDLTPLAEAYEAAYGPIGAERPTVVLRLWDPLSGSPVGRLVEVVL